MKKDKIFGFIKKDNKAGDVGIIGLMIIFISAMLLTMSMDLFTGMLAKEYVINALQVAEMNALVKNVDTNVILNGGESAIESRIKSDFSSDLRQRIRTGNTSVFKSITYPSGANILTSLDTKDNIPTAAYIECVVTFQPKRFIKGPIALFGVKSIPPSVATGVSSKIVTFKA